MRKIIIHDFREDILEQSLKHIQDGTIMVYPTRQSARLAHQSYHPLTGLCQVEFLAIEDLKTMMLAPDKPLIQDEKRLLALYQVLEPEDKAIFHLEEYADLIPWGGNFFSFFAELCEEEVDLKRLEDLEAGAEFFAQGWQIEFIQRVLAIRLRYREFIGGLGFEDRIFTHGAKALHPLPLYTNYVFVNQYYYTSLEKSMISFLEEQGKGIVILLQGEKEWFDTQNLKVREPELTSLLKDKRYRLRKLSIDQKASRDAMLLSFLARFPEDKATRNQAAEAPSVLFDKHFLISGYQAWFEPSDLGLTDRIAITRLPLYQFILALESQLESIIEESPAGSTPVLLLPLAGLQKLCCEEWFISYFLPGSDSGLRDRITRLLAKLTEENYLYLDLELRLLDMVEDAQLYTPLKDLLSRYFGLLKRCRNLASISDLISLLDVEDGIRIKALVPEDIFLGTEFYPMLYRRLASFAVAENQGIVRSWDLIFPPQKIAAGIIGLCAQNLKSLSFSFSSPASGPPLYQLSNLLDSRNLNLRKMVFLHLVEGELPGKAEAVWLLNETQKGRLGLKTWEDVRRWERYYFFRTLLCSREAVLYTYRDVESEIEPSSFISELRLYAEQGLLEIDELLSPPLPLSALYMGLYTRERMSAGGRDSCLPSSLQDTSLCKVRKDSPWEFFSLPCDPAEDFANQGELKLTYYALEQFLKNPFVWYLSSYSRIQELSICPEEAISRKFFGELQHRFISKVFAIYLEAHPDSLVRDSKLINSKSLEEKLLELLNEARMQYKIPKNHNREFLKEIMAENLVDCVKWVFTEYLPSLEPGFSGQLEILPEKDLLRDEEKPYKTLIPPQENSLGVKLMIRGKADLRINSPLHYFIIDFKTGKGHENQLIFYEYLYFLLHDPEAESRLDSRFCQIFELEGSNQGITTKKREAFLAKLLAQLELIHRFGFLLPRTIANRNDKIRITRADLFSYSMLGLDATSGPVETEEEA
ncbi:MAG: PD-(D/E)XK nuclease family protein [Candidatus Cloacimonetes bacterium]|nr:PD-(D/E)XK nuclease family protein [Candidatus Cloacimonadota bacterium]